MISAAHAHFLDALEATGRAQAKFRRKIRRLLGAAALLWSLLALIALALFFPQIHATTLRVAGIWILSLGLLKEVVWAGVRRKRPPLSHRPRRWLPWAMRLGQSRPELASALQTAVEFSLPKSKQAEQTKQSTEQTSSALKQAHIDRVAIAIDANKPDLRDTSLWQKWCKPAQWALALGFAAHCVLWVAHPAARALVMAAARGTPLPAQPSQAPLFGDLKLTITPPPHTHQSVVQQVGVSGKIEAQVGSQIVWQATSARDAIQASLVQKDAAGSSKTVLQIPTPRSLEGSFKLLKSGHYHLELRDNQGTLWRSAKAYPMVAIPDAHPKATIVEPISHDQVTPKQEIHVHWQAKDDHGLRSIALVAERDGVEVLRKDAAKIPGVMRQNSGEINFVANAELFDEDGRLALWIEATDNTPKKSPYLGPQTSRSHTVWLNLYDSQKERDDLVDAQQNALDALIDLLAKHLQPTSQNPSAQKRACIQAIAQTQTRLQALGARLKLAQQSLPALQQAFSHIALRQAEAQRTLRQASRANATAWEQAHKKAIQELEHDVVYLDDLLNQSRLDSLHDVAQSLLQKQSELQTALKAYAQKPSMQDKARIQKEITGLKKQIKDLMHRMAKIRKRLPSEYQNVQASQNLAMTKQLENIEKMLEGDADDVARMAQELEGLANQVHNMIAAIEHQERENHDTRYAQLRKDLNAFEKQFSNLENEEAALQERSEKWIAQAQQKSRAGKSISDSKKRATKALQNTLETLDTWVDDPKNPMRPYELSDAQAIRQALMDTDALLKADAWDQAQKQAGFAEKRLRFPNLRPLQKRVKNPKTQTQAKRNAHKKAQALMDALDTLLPNNEMLYQNGNIQKLDGMHNKQTSLVQNAQALLKSLPALNTHGPIVSPEAQKTLQNAVESMQKAKGAFQQKTILQAEQAQKEALLALQKFRQDMQASQDGDAKQGEGGQGQSGQGQNSNQGGASMPSLPRPFSTPKSGGQRMGQGQNQGQNEGRGPSSDLSVAIPKASKETDAQFRKALQQASQHPPPKRYKKAVERYRQELLQ